MCWADITCNPIMSCEAIQVIFVPCSVSLHQQKSVRKNVVKKKILSVWTLHVAVCTLWAVNITTCMLWHSPCFIASISNPADFNWEEHEKKVTHIYEQKVEVFHLHHFPLQSLSQLLQSLWALTAAPCCVLWRKLEICWHCCGTKTRR